MAAPLDNTWLIQPLHADGTNNGAAKSHAALGIESANYDFNQLAADIYTFTVGGRPFNAATLWPYGTLLALIHPNGKRFFVGRVEPWNREGRPDSQNHLGRLVNPWWYLVQLMYEQSYRLANLNGGNDAPITYSTYTTSRVVLNVLFEAATQRFANANTGAQIRDALNWAIGKGAPITIGQLDPATLPFSRFEKGITCADVIKYMFRFEPDFVMDWDYTTLPFPTVHFRKVPSLTPITIDLTKPGVFEQVNIKERPDWQRSFVRINYDQTDSTNGAQYLATYVDWYSANGQGGINNGVGFGAALPNDTESNFRGVVLFCDLSGSQFTSTTQTAQFSSLPFDITSLATWQDWKPSLTAPNVAGVVILTQNSIPAADATRLPPAIATADELDAGGNAVAYNPANSFEVVDGEWADWIPKVTAQRVRVTATAMIHLKNGEVKYEQLNHDMTVVSLNTNGLGKQFTTTQGNTGAYAEPVPNGLAQSMWTSWQNLAIEGSFTNVEWVINGATIAQALQPGQTVVVAANQIPSRSTCLNFLTLNPGQNGQPDWRNVNALVQRLSGDIEKGTTRIDFGAPLHITGHDLIDAVRATRYRVTTMDLSYLFGGPLGGGSGSNVTLGRKTHARHSQGGAAHTQDQAVSAAVAPAVGVDALFFTQGASAISSWTPPNAPVAGDVSTPQVVINPASARGDDGTWHPLAIAQIPFCQTQPDGTQKQRSIMILASAPFKGANDPV